MPVAEPDQPVGQRDEAVAVPVAARRLGKSPDAIRSAIRRGKLSATKGNDGDWLVYLPAEMPKIAQFADSLQPSLDRALADLDRIRAELEQARQQAADSLATVAELRERLARIEGESDGRRIAAAADIAAKDAVISEMRIALEWHRTPWWQRMLTMLRR